jgi:hypothetical protein
MNEEDCKKASVSVVVKMACTSAIYAVLVVILALLGGWVIDWVFRSGVLGDPR